MRHAFRAILPTLVVAGLLLGTATANAAALGTDPAAGAATSRTAQTHHHNATAASTRKIALGISVNNQKGTLDTNWQAVLNVKTKSGHYPALWSIWSNWTGPSAPFPTRSAPAFMANLKVNHIVPILVWQPTNGGDNPSAKYRNERITAGDFDPYIRKWAKDAKAYGSTIILRFAQEMNGSWNPWGVGHFTNTSKSYIKMWKHVWDIFHGKNGGVNATNVKFLWSPYQPCGQDIGCVDYSKVFPGNSFVNYIGYSSFNWHTKTGTGHMRPWTNMVTVMKTGYKKLVALSSKPIIVAELGSNRVGGSQSTWVANGYPAAYAAYPHIAAIVYFNVDMTRTGDPSQANWTLTTASWAVYKQLAGQKHFRGVIP